MEDSEFFFYICVPVYKTEKYLDECIQSVQNQTYGNFQLILVDDGSPDRCGAICDQYAALDSRITALHQTNQGQIKARQAALDYIHSHLNLEDMKNAFVLFLDSDDTWEENALEVIAEKIHETGCDLLIFGADLVCDGKKVGKFGKSPAFEGVLTDKSELYSIVLCDSCYNSLCRKAVQASLTLNRDNSRFADLRHGEDLMQSLDYYRDAQKVAFVDEALYNYTQNPVSVTHSITYENYHLLDSTTRRTVLEFVQQENVWGPQQFSRYYRYCRELLFREVLRLSDFRTSIRNRIGLLTQILEDPFYVQILQEEKNRGFFLNSLVKRHYYMTIFKAQAYERLRIVYNRLRKTGSR